MPETGFQPGLAEPRAFSGEYAGAAPKALFAEIDRISPLAVNSGIVGNDRHRSGYHRSRNWLVANGHDADYSIQAADDRIGPGFACSALDVSFPTSLMKLYTTRMVKACEANDPRLYALREVLGTMDGSTVVGYNRVATGSGTRSKVGRVSSSDTSHLWHMHFSILRKYADDRDAALAIASVFAGLPAPSPAPTTARFLQANLRRSDLAEASVSRQWEQRRESALQALANIGPDIIGVQECTPEQAADVQEGLGVNWTFAGLNHNVRVMWDGEAFDAVPGTLLEVVLPSGQRNRYLTMIRLQHRVTGWGVWAGSLHLASGGSREPNEQQLRLAQIKQATEAINAHTAKFSFPADDTTANVMLMADINDPTQPGGVRAEALKRGFKPLQNRDGQVGRLPLDQISGESINSFNGWRTPTPRDGKWIDEIFSRGLLMSRAGLRRTDKDVLPNYASDHNWIDADVKMELAVLP